MTSTATVVDHITAAVDYLRIEVEDDGAPLDGDAPLDGVVDDGVEWLASSRLTSDPDHLLEVVRSTAEGRGTDRDDVAMSLFVQAYAFRLAAAGIGGWLTDAVALDLRPEATSVAIGRHRPNALLLRGPAAPARADALARLHRTLVDEHLAVLFEVVHEACDIGDRLLWGNLGAACASSFGAFMAPWADRRAWLRDRVEEFFAAARPELADAGTLVHVGPVWAWERTSCCMWYLTDSGFKCQDCSLWKPGERQERYDGLLAELR